jgi:branched-chain amino acid transport system ATP-binding protein
MGMSFLEVHNINVFYGDVQVLEDVSLSVTKGEIVSIVGSNASGKSTTINAICGLLPVSSGEIHFLGNRIENRELHEIARMGIAQIPEGRRLFPYMSVYENLAIGAYAPRARASEGKSLEEVYALFPALKERRSQMAVTLSGGEQQMVAIGRGLMARPEILILDEPSLGIAPILVKEIFEKITQINKKGTTILLVEQDVALSLNLSDHGYVLENGSITLEGGGKELLANPQIRESYLGM